MNHEIAKNERKAIDALKSKGYHLIRLAPKVWENMSTKKTVTACRTTLENLYGKLSTDNKYADRLMQDYGCWFYKMENGEPRTYLFTRSPSKDKSKNNAILYKLVVNVWLKFFHSLPVDEYRKMKCDINKPTFDVRIFENDERRHHRGEGKARRPTQRKPQNTKKAESDEEENSDSIASDSEPDEEENEDEIEDDDVNNNKYLKKNAKKHDPIVDDDEDDEEREKNKILSGLELYVQKGRVPKKFFDEDMLSDATDHWQQKPSRGSAPSSQTKRKRMVDEIQESSSAPSSDVVPYNSTPTPPLKLATLKKQPLRMVAFVQSNPTHFREYRVSHLCFLKLNCDDEFQKLFPRTFDSKQMIQSLKESLSMSEEVLKNPPASNRVLRELKPKTTTTPTPKRLATSLTNNNATTPPSPAPSYFPSPSLPSNTGPYSTLIQKIITDATPVAAKKHFLRTPLPAVIKAKPGEGFWKLICIQNYLIEHTPELARLELNKPLQQYSPEEEIILTIVFINCFTPKKTNMDAIISEVPENITILINNSKINITQAKHVNEKLTYMASHFLQNEDPNSQEFLVSRRLKSHGIVGDSFGILDDLNRKIREKTAKIDPRAASEQLKNTTAFFQRLDLSLFSVLIASLNTWFPSSFVAFDTLFPFTQNELEHQIIQ